MKRAKKQVPTMLRELGLGTPGTEIAPDFPEAMTPPKRPDERAGLAGVRPGARFVGLAATAKELFALDEYGQAWRYHAEHGGRWTPVSKRREGR